MTRLVLQRLRYDDGATQGNLILDGHLLCRTLENRPPRIPGLKEPGKSRIPEGDWPLRTRAEGGFFQRYTKTWDWHGPMVEVVLPGWKYILFHVGNYNENTDGCILVGETHGSTRDRGYVVWNSSKAYARIYPKLLELAEKGVLLSIRDEDQPPPMPQDPTPPQTDRRLNRFAGTVVRARRTPATFTV